MEMLANGLGTLPVFQTAPRDEGGPERAPGLEHRSLRALVHHGGAVAYDAPLESVQRTFSERQVEFLALVRDGLVTGICSRSRLGALLGARFGFALYSRSPAHLAQVARPLVVSETAPLRDVLDQALGRPGDEFHEDIALVDANHTLVGLVPIDALARLQNQLVSEQLVQLQRQHAELRVAHHARRQSQGRYAGLFDSHTLGVALVDVEGAVDTHNRRLAEILNVDADADGFASLTAWVSETERDAFRATLRELRNGAAPVTREWTLMVPERGARLFRCSFGWIEETQQVCVCLDDITEQRLMERQLARQEKQTLLDTLVGGIAHELNNKLTPVHGFSELICMSADGPVRHYGELISKSVAEAASIIRQLLQLSKPNATVTQVVDLRVIVDEALSMLRFQVRETRCRLRTTHASEAVWVRADPAEIKQVVINLALNALQAMVDRAHATLEIEVRADAGSAQLIVSDNGIGIPPENIERIFDPFFTTKGPERGTGLGLSVCFSIVRQHGGQIAVASTPGAGASFTVSLPREAAGPARTMETAALAPALWREAQTPTTREARVLVVEDEGHVRRLIRDVLISRFGCEVDTVANGVEALERLASHRYTLVLSDVRMATMNGTELLLWLREAQPATADRFIFITGYPGENHLQAEVAEWNIPVLTKPFSIQTLCDTCEPYLDRGSCALPAAS